MLVAKPIAAITIDLDEQYKKKKKNKGANLRKQKKKEGDKLIRNEKGGLKKSKTNCRDHNRPV